MRYPSFWKHPYIPSCKLRWQWKIRILCRKYIFKWSLFQPAMLVYQSARSSNGIHGIFSGGCPSDTIPKKIPLERIMPYYSRSLTGKSWTSASFNHRPQPPATLESPLKTWRHWVPLVRRWTRGACKSAWLFGCKSAMVGLSTRNSGFEILEDESFCTWRIFPRQYSLLDLMLFFLLGQTGVGRRFVPSITTWMDLDGLLCYPGSTLRSLQQGFKKRNLRNFPKKLLPLALDLTSKNIQVKHCDFLSNAFPPIYVDVSPWLPNRDWHEKASVFINPLIFETVGTQAHWLSMWINGTTERSSEETDSRLSFYPPKKNPSNNPPKSNQNPSSSLERFWVSPHPLTTLDLDCLL